MRPPRPAAPVAVTAAPAVAAVATVAAVARPALPRRGRGKSSSKSSGVGRTSLALRPAARPPPPRPFPLISRRPQRRGRHSLSSTSAAARSAARASLDRRCASAAEGAAGRRAVRLLIWLLEDLGGRLVLAQRPFQLLVRLEIRRGQRRLFGRPRLRLRRREEQVVFVGRRGSSPRSVRSAESISAASAPRRSLRGVLAGLALGRFVGRRTLPPPGPAA